MPRVKATTGRPKQTTAMVAARRLGLAAASLACLTWGWRTVGRWVKNGPESHPNFFWLFILSSQSMPGFDVSVVMKPDVDQTIWVLRYEIWVFWYVCTSKFKLNSFFSLSAYCAAAWHHRQRSGRMRREGTNFSQKVLSSSIPSSLLGLVWLGFAGWLACFFHTNYEASLLYSATFINYWW